MSNKKDLGDLKETDRGFSMIEFNDYYNQTVTLQCSSVIIEDYEDSFDKPGTSALWLGLKDPEVKFMAKDAEKLNLDIPEKTGWVDYPLPECVHVFQRAHLNREQVKGLIKRLNEWLENGHFK